jgi:hypothetical protein
VRRLHFVLRELVTAVRNRSACLAEQQTICAVHIRTPVTVDGSVLRTVSGHLSPVHSLPP